MRLCMRSPLFLILFTIFSVLYFGVTAIAQTEQPLSPAQAALEEAKAEKLDAEQKKNDAQAALDAATETLNIAEQQLQKAQVAANQEDQALKDAEAAVIAAQNKVNDAQADLDQVQSELDTLNQQLADAQNKVNDATTAKDTAEQVLQEALAKVAEIKGQPVDGGSNPTNPGDGGTGNIAFTTITPKLLEHDCKEPPGDSTTGVLGDPEEMVDGNPRTNFTCKGLFTAKFALAEKMVIDAVNVQSEHEFPSFTGNTAKVYVDDKEVAEQDIPTHCQTCELLPTRVDFDNVEGQFITIEFTKALPNEKNAIESEIAEVSVVAGKR